MHPFHGAHHLVHGDAKLLGEQVGLAGDPLGPFALAHGVGRLLVVAVEHPKILADGVGVGLGGGPQDGRGLGDTLQHGGGQARHRLLHGAGVLQHPDRRLAVVHRELQGGGAEAVQHLPGHVGGGHLGQSLLHLDSRGEGGRDGQPAGYHGGGPQRHLLVALADGLAERYHLLLDAEQRFGDVVDQRHLHHQLFHPGHGVIR
ncbi:hypothetical protein D3C80_1015300 [compost metagenome]